MSDPVLKVDNLEVSLQSRNRILKALESISFEIRPGETLGLVGESGCGKSLTSLALMGLLPKNLKITAGEIFIAGRRVNSIPREERRRLRGSVMSMVFQEPMTALNPVMTVGNQIAEMFVVHRETTWAVGRAEAKRLLDEVGIPEAQKRLDDYPHQLSGGMRQRIIIAIAIALNPKIMVLDEPTTALDVTVQAQILELLKALQKEHQTAYIFISHDMGIMSDFADHLAVMYAGRIVETGPTTNIFSRPRHPYTQGLLNAIPSVVDSPEKLYSIEGVVPTLAEFEEGCRFANRCPSRATACDQRPQMNDLAGHRVWCFHPVIHGPKGTVSQSSALAS